MRVIGKLFGIIFAILFVITAVAALIAYNAETRMVSAETYKEVLVEQKVYDRAPALAAGFIVQQMKDSVEPGSAEAKSLENVTPGEVAKALSAAVPMSEVKTLAEDAIDKVFAFLDAKINSVAISTVRIKAAIRKNGLAALHSVMDSKPVCSAKQMANYDPTKALICKPPEKLAAKMDKEFQAMFDNMVADVPDNAEIVSADVAAQHGEDLANVRMARLAMSWSPVVPILLLLLIALFAARSTRGWMRWWGVPLLIAGVIGAGASLASGSMLASFAAEAIASGNYGHFPPDINEAALGMIGAVSQSLLSPIFIQASVLAVLGLLLIVGSFFVPRPEAATGEG